MDKDRDIKTALVSARSPATVSCFRVIDITLHYKINCESTLYEKQIHFYKNGTNETLEISKRSVNLLKQPTHQLIKVLCNDRPQTGFTSSSTVCQDT